MKMAKASEADLEMAMELCSALDALTGWGAAVPEKIANPPDDEDVELFDRDSREQCVRVLGHLLDLAGSASLMRVVWGCAVMLDPKNKCVDPDAHSIEHHPDTKAGIAAKQTRPLNEWHEDMGPVLWWSFPIEEEPWCGTPNFNTWPGYHTHWTPLVVPDAPAQGQSTPKEEAHS